MKKLAILVLCMVGFFGGAMSVRAATDVPDGSFENFDYTWNCDLNCTQAVNYYFIFSGSAYDGIAYAYLFHDAGVYQDLTLPSDVASLSFWYDNQPDSMVPEDGSFTIYLMNPDTNEVYAQQLYDTQSDGWINGTLTIPSALKGQPVLLYISNTTGYNRIDFLQFNSTADTLADLQQTYATVRMRILSSTGKPVKNAVVFIKHKGVRLDLMNLTTLTSAKKVTTNKKGRTHKFLIIEDPAEGNKTKICARKKSITECVPITTTSGVETHYDFNFGHSAVK